MPAFAVVEQSAVVFVGAVRPAAAFAVAAPVVVASVVAPFDVAAPVVVAFVVGPAAVVAVAVVVGPTAAVEQVVVVVVVAVAVDASGPLDHERPVLHF